MFCLPGPSWPRTTALPYAAGSAAQAYSPARQRAAMPVRQVFAAHGPLLKPFSSRLALQVVLPVPKDAYSVDFVFSDAYEGGQFDNKGGLDYHLPVEGSVVEEPPLNVCHIAVEMAPICKVCGQGGGWKGKRAGSWGLVRCRVSDGWVHGWVGGKWRVWRGRKHAWKELAAPAGPRQVSFVPACLSHTPEPHPCLLPAPRTSHTCRSAGWAMW